jgi:DNA-binding PadR family transcriptional regulator
MRGDKLKYNKSIVYPAIINLAYYNSHKSQESGCTVRDVMNFCPENSTSVNNVTQIIKLLRAKGLMEEAGENRTQKNAVMYRLTNLGKQLLSKCNSEMVVLYELISSNNTK